MLISSCPQDSLLAAPIIMDLVILAELVTRIQLKKDGQEELRGFHPVAVLLSYLTKVGGHRADRRGGPPRSSPCTRFEAPRAWRSAEPAMPVVALPAHLPASCDLTAALLPCPAQAPLVPSGTPVVNALAKQRAMLENVFRACVGLPPENNMMLVGGLVRRPLPAARSGVPRAAALWM